MVVRNSRNGVVKYTVQHKAFTADKKGCALQLYRKMTAQIA